MNRFDPYAAHNGFVRPARRHPETWRICVVFFGMAAAFVYTPSAMAILAPGASAEANLITATSPQATLANLLSFAASLVALIVLVRLMHQRGLSTLTGDTGNLRRNLWRVAFSVGLVLAVQEPLFLWMDWSILQEVRDVGQWSLWVLPAILALLVQVGTEELFFRGYLQQQLAAQSPSKWVWMGAPSLIFALAHMPNAEDPVTAFFWVFWAGLLGLACADLTARTGNLGAAIGLHLANNIFALLIIGVADAPMSGLALFLYPPVDPVTAPEHLGVLLEPGMLFQLLLASLSLAVMWLAARLTLRL